MEEVATTNEVVNRPTVREPSDMFFDDENGVPDPAAPAPTIISRSEKPQDSKRRRRPTSQHPTVVLPDFENELKDEIRTARGAHPTALPNGGIHSAVKSRGTKASDKRAALPEQRSRREDKPRRIGSQILDLREGFAVNLGAIEEDIVALSNDDLRAAIRQTTLRAKDNGEAHAQLSSRLYVEDSEKGKFYTLSKRPKEWDTTTIDDQIPDTTNKINDNSSTTWSSDVSIYRTIRHVFLFSHGFLAGLALLHCILLYALTPPQQADWLFFVRPYIHIAIVFRTLYHVLITLCAVSCLCRLDILSGFDKGLVTRYLDAVVATVLYFGAAVLTHLCDSTVTRLMLEWHTMPDVLSPEVLEELVRFRIMDAVRTACVCITWLFTAFRWKHDRFKEYLHIKSA